MSAGFERLFASREGMTNPVEALRELIRAEAAVVARLQDYGLVSGEEWRVLDNGFEIRENGIFSSDDELLNTFREWDRELAFRFGALADEEVLSSDEVYVDKSHDPNFSYFIGDYLFRFLRYTKKGQSEENEIRKIYNRKFVKALSEAGLERNKNWMLGPEELNSSVNFRRVYYTNVDEWAMEAFESIATVYDAELRKVIRAYRGNPDLASQILGKENIQQMNNELSSEVLASLREYVFSDQSPFNGFNLSSLNASEIGSLGLSLKKMEDKDNFSFSNLTPDEKEDKVRHVFVDTGVIPGYSPFDFTPPEEGSGAHFFYEFISKLSTNRHIFSLFKEITKNEGVRIGDFLGRADQNLYEKLITMNRTDALKVDSVISKAYYEIFRPSGPMIETRAEDLLMALSGYVLFEILREYRGKIRYRPVEGNPEVNEEKRKRYQLLVHEVLASIGKELFASIFDLVPGKMEYIVDRFPTVESFKGTPFMVSVRSRMYSEIAKAEQKIIENKQ